MNTPGRTLAELLTRRERKILSLLAGDLSNREIASTENLTLDAVKSTIQQIYAKLGVSNRPGALERARNLGMLGIPASPETPQAALPAGTVTFLFTDIVGSTPFWEQQPAGMAAALQVHNAALKRAIEANHGVVFKTVGDAFQAAFSTALQALQAAIQGQRALSSAPWNELGPLLVRMGLHTGEAELDPGGDEYAVSHTKNRAARIMSAAHGGQILLSAETGELINHQLPPGVSLKDLGEHRLKGMSLSEHLYQACAPELPQVYPSLATVSAPLNNLPIQFTSFIGREREIGEVRLLLEKHRLVTLTGSGGTGKTRLSLRAAGEQMDAFPDGVWLVELAPLADPAIIPQTVISALGQTEQPGRTPTAYLADYLHQKQLLLILDNCEHLVEACAELVDGLLRAAPRLKILASSREILGVVGEIPYRVPPLATPDPRRLPPLEELSSFDAVRLFVERARVVSPEFEITEDNAAAVAQITHRLDGIPLAIELAAARVRMLSAAQIARRLDDAFRLLTGGARTALPRHQTLTALIDWSYNLLSEAERGLLRSLSAFAGSWTLEAAEEVCHDQRIQAWDVLDLLAQLADKSLILASQAADGEMYYRMLETVRQYAHARMVEAGESEAVRGRHLVYFLRLAERLEPKLRGPEQIATLDRLEGELDNLRLALEWALQVDIEAELRLAAALMWLWHIRVLHTEGVAWLEQGLEAEKLTRGGLPSLGSRAVIRARALAALGFHLLIWNNPDHSNGLVSIEEAVALYRASGPEHRAGLAWALRWLVWYKSDEGKRDQALALCQEALSLFRACGDAHGTAESLMFLGDCEVVPLRQKKIYQEVLAIDEANGDVEGIATALLAIGGAGYSNGDYEGAGADLEASLARYLQVGNSVMAVFMKFWICVIAHSSGNLERASFYLEEALADSREMANNGMVAWCLFWQCMLFFTQGHYDRAAESIAELERIVLKTGHPGSAAHVLYIRARLARLQGDLAAARPLAQEGLNIALNLGAHKMLTLLELGYLALQDGDLARARGCFVEGFQAIIQRREITWASMPLDGLALLALRAGQRERAAYLFGTRQWRGFAHMLSPIERAERDAAFTEITTALGVERFAQLRAEGAALPFDQILALAQEPLVPQV